MRSHHHPKRWRSSRTALAILAGVAVALAGSVTPAGAQTAAGPTAGEPSKVAPQVQKRVDAKSGERVRALVMLHNAQRLNGSRGAVVSALKRHANSAQHDLEARLERHPRTAGDVTVINRFWATNMLLVEFTADSRRLQAMAAMSGVRRVIPNFAVSLPKPAESTSPGTASGHLTWGLERIQAKRVWDELGIDGSGVRVATLDTGVDISHPDLAGKMVTDNPSDPNYPGGWMEFNSSGNLVRSEPHDSHYHGTHVSGTIQGGDSSGTHIGAAPGADMMHGLVIPGGGGTFAQVAAGMQWAIAPTDADGNPAGQPADVVNMSLGGNGFHEEMIPPTRAMRAAGTFPAFAIGNNCGSSGTASPGNVYDAVGVGATDVSDNVAGFSCGGVIDKSRWTDPPADWPDSYVKPDISAPGVDVWSASPGGGYRTLSGTSMATPHTAATVALMRSAAPELTVDQVFNGLADTAFWDDRYADAPPDTRFGRGRINAYEATANVAIDSGISGAVTDANNGKPIEDATVTVTPGDREVTTDSDGRYTVRVEPGTYSVKTSAFGYRDATADNVQVTAENFTTVDTTLRRGPRGNISGVVTFDQSGEGVPGVAVEVRGTPVPFTATSGADGRYTIADVPVGTYTVAASHPRFTAPSAVEVTVSDGGTAAADYVFGAPPRTVALVGRYVDKFQEVVFAPRGIETVIYSWDELDQAAQHSTIVLGYGFSSEYDEAKFQAFLDATDASGAGVVFTHHAFGSGSSIIQLSRHTGQPETTGQNSGGSSSTESYYDITADHPIFAGRAVGDRIILDDSTQSKWIGWFDNYAGEGRQIIATVGRSGDDIGGGGIAVDQRANNRHVLMGSHGVSVTRGPSDWTPEATQLFFNALTWASPPPTENQPYYAVHNLQVGPDVVKGNETVTVTADVKNIGASAGTYEAALTVNGQVSTTKTVALAQGESATLQWTLSGHTDLGVYDVRLEYLSGSFRVRAPIVNLTASTLAAGSEPGAAAGPLTGATVELIDDGAVVGVGSTDADGKLSFEIPDVAGDYTLVLRRDHINSGDEAYLLHRDITVNDDRSVTFAPQASGTGADAVTRADLRLNRVNADHTAQVFVRPTGTAPYGYNYQPGTLVASTDTYEAVIAHRVNLQEQDWWLPSQIVSDLDWTGAGDASFAFGGSPSASISEASVAADGQVSVDWSVTDAYGRPFETVLSGDVRPFADLPEVVELERIEALVRAKASNEQKPILRLFAPTGEQARAGSIEWDAQPYSFALDADAIGGKYGLALESGVGGYGDTAKAAATMQVGDLRLSTTRPDKVVTKSVANYEVRAVNSGAEAGPFTWTVRVASASGDLSPRDVVLKVLTDKGTKRVDLNPDGEGGLVGTVADNVTLAPGEHVWQMSLQVSGTGVHTFVDTFTGDSASVATHDKVTGASRLDSRGVGSGDNRLAGVGG